MIEYVVLLEASVRKQVKIAADSPEHAARLAREMCSSPQTLQVSMQATWVDTSEQAEAVGEFSMEIIGECDTCGDAIVSRDRPDRPWLYTSDGTNNHEGMICYTCAAPVVDQLGDIAR